MNLGMERLFDYQVEDDDKTALIANDDEVNTVQVVPDQILFLFQEVITPGDIPSGAQLRERKTGPVNSRDIEDVSFH